MSRPASHTAATVVHAEMKFARENPRVGWLVLARCSREWYGAYFWDGCVLLELLTLCAL
jgi:hypothetical protein